MSNRHVRELSRVYASILEDACAAYPTLGDEFEKDLSRLLRLVAQRGIHVFVVDLPALGKHFDKCLSHGQYKLSGLPLSRRYSNRVVIPKLFRGLYLLVYDKSGRLKEDYDVEAVFFLRQLFATAARTTIACSDEAVIKEIDDFIATDNRLPEPHWFWENEAPEPSDVSSFAGFVLADLYRGRVSGTGSARCATLSILLRKLDLVSSLVCSTLGSYCFRDWNFRHGPGAVSSPSEDRNKYRFRSWSDRLEKAFPIADCGFHNYSSWASSWDVGPLGQAREDVSPPEPCSRLISVPKTFVKPRLIAAEPSEHQWCQQNVWHFFRTRIGNSWIDKFVRFTDQTLNQELCLRGSQDGSLATVDLSSASDRVSCHVVGQVFRRNPGLLLALQASRTRQIMLPETHGFRKHELRKFSTMGSACTFPVESLVFLVVTLASVLTVRHEACTLRNIRKLYKEVAIYGDDIIVPADSRELLVEALEILDFKVNSDKSYWTGLFRESCGVESFAGVNVTPAYWKSLYDGKPESIASTVDVRNNFHKRGLFHTSAYIASTIRGVHVPPVTMASGVCGFKTFARVTGWETNRLRLNCDLQRLEISVPMLQAKVRKVPITDDTALLQYFTENPGPFVFWKGGIAQRPSTVLRYGWVPIQDVTAQEHP